MVGVEVISSTDEVMFRMYVVGIETGTSSSGENRRREIVEEDFVEEKTFEEKTVQEDFVEGKIVE
jgi:hypothetical protein